MGPGEVLPGRDPPVRAEIVHESDRTRVTRLFLPGGTVIRKEPLGPDAERRARHEAAILERLRGVAGVIQLADAPRYRGSVVLADAGGTSLAEAGKPLPVDDLAGLAVGLARAMAGMHRRGIMHRDITPANFVVSGDGTPCLVDFAVAAPLAEAGPEFTGQRELVGTLAYLAPEATGRTGRAVDARADLYALGAVLYELATGGPPFGSGDPLRLAHDHLARVPVPPDQVNPAVPAGLSQVIKHLLEKDPDRRYQSADGVVADLERVREAGGRPVAGWRAGERDVPGRLLAPSRLAGRAEQVAALQAALKEAVAGRCAGVLVGGAPGVGKTALAGWLRPAVAARGAGSWRASPTRSGGIWSSTRSIRRCARWAGCCWPSRRRTFLASAGGFWRRRGRTRGCWPRRCRSSRRAAGDALRSGGSTDRAGPGAACGGGGAAGGGVAGPAGGGVRG